MKCAECMESDPRISAAWFQPRDRQKKRRGNFIGHCSAVEAAALCSVTCPSSTPACKGPPEFSSQHQPRVRDPSSEQAT